MILLQSPMLETSATNNLEVTRGRSGYGLTSFITAETRPSRLVELFEQGEKEGDNPTLINNRRASDNVNWRPEQRMKSWISMRLYR